jgi:hypothetical protein
MPDSKFKTLASLGKYHARVGLNTPNDVGDVMVGALLEDMGYTVKDIPFTGYIGTAQWVRTHAGTSRRSCARWRRARNWPSPA